MAAHRYWRLYGVGASSPYYGWTVSEFQFRTVAGTSLLFSGGTASANGSGGGAASNATDNDINTFWSITSAATPYWWQYDYGAGNDIDIAEVTVQARNDIYYAQTPETFLIQYSDDGSTWTVAGSFQAAAWNAAAQIQTFTLPTPRATFLTTLDTLQCGPNLVLSNGDLTVTGDGTSGTDWQSVVAAVQPLASGKKYYEATATLESSGAGYMIFGVGPAVSNLFDHVGWDNSGAGLQDAFNQFVFNGGGIGGSGLSVNAGSVVGVAVDIANNLMWATLDGSTWGPSGNPASGTGGFSMSGRPAQAILPAFSIDNHSASDEITVNFAGPFSYAVPAGFSSWAPATSLTAAPAAGAISFTGFAPSLDLTLAPDVGAVAFTGFAPSPVGDAVVSPGAGSIVFVGFAPGDSLTLEPAAGAIAFAGYAPVPVSASPAAPMFSIIV